MYILILEYLIADGQDDPIKLKAMVKHWSQQMSAAVNREASRNVVRKASQMEDKASLAQRNRLRRRFFTPVNPSQR